MPALTTRRDCGSLLDLRELQRRLPLGHPIREGQRTIRVAQIVGTASRLGDFDGCWRPLKPHLRKRIEEIRAADSMTMLEAIDVFRVDEAYFVADGHKRVAIARQTGMEFIDARVERLPTQYHVAPGVDSASVAVTAAEHRFRKETGLAEAVPHIRFPLWDARDYDELAEAVAAQAYKSSQQLGRLLSPPEAAAIWYECVYLPTLRAARENRVTELISACTETYLFLWLHRQSRAVRGRELTAAEAVVKRVIEEERQHRASTGSPVQRLLSRARGRRAPGQLLPEETADEAVASHEHS